jgi:hypothetical protein
MIAAAAPGPMFDFKEQAPPFPNEMEYPTITEITDGHKTFFNPSLRFLQPFAYSPSYSIPLFDSCFLPVARA